MNDEFYTDDELTDDDLEFLAQWEKAGHNADEHESLEVGKDTPEGHAEVEIQAESENKVESDEAEESDSGESDDVDESKMDISDMSPDDGELGDYSEADDDNLTESDEPEDDYMESESDHLGNDSEEPDEIPEGEDDLEYDPLDESDEDSDSEDYDTEQREEEFGEGERADTDEEIDDLDEYERERDEHEQELNSEAEDDYKGDAQDELDKHLENNQEDSEPESDEEDDDTEDSDGGSSEPDTDDDYDENSDDETPEDHDEKDTPEEPEPLTESPDENSEDADEQHSGMFETLPEAGDQCTNHCEDNLDEELEETCPHCMERIRKERELHGAIATDMHGNDLLPGDRIRTRIPIAMIAKDSILSVNVPNSEVDPKRLAQNTRNEIDVERCWLSGRGISNFTGWRMTEVENRIWTFKKGQHLGFAEKLADPEFDETDPEKMIEDLKDELDNFGKENQEEDERPEDDNEPEGDSEGSEDGTPEEDGEPDSDEPEIEDIEIEEEEPKREPLNGLQKKRFEKLTERNWKKILITYGETVEAEIIKPIVEHDDYIERQARLVSRGVLYSFSFTARREDEDDIDNILDEFDELQSEDEE